MSLLLLMLMPLDTLLEDIMYCGALAEKDGQRGGGGREGVGLGCVVCVAVVCVGRAEYVGVD